ncbi:hypothetical protein B0J14DRAFT_562642 [Halenospora varia]|nr:hypothetical protein B0J14DRAFT_562642 [Halenospora varia]
MADQQALHSIALAQSALQEIDGIDTAHYFHRNLDFYLQSTKDKFPRIEAAESSDSQSENDDGQTIAVPKHIKDCLGCLSSFGSKFDCNIDHNMANKTDISHENLSMTLWENHGDPVLEPIRTNREKVNYPQGAVNPSDYSSRGYWDVHAAGINLEESSQVPENYLLPMDWGSDDESGPETAQGATGYAPVLPQAQSEDPQDLPLVENEGELDITHVAETDVQILSPTRLETSPVPQHVENTNASEDVHRIENVFESWPVFEPTEEDLEREKIRRFENRSQLLPPPQLVDPRDLEPIIATPGCLAEDLDNLPQQERQTLEQAKKIEYQCLELTIKWSKGLAEKVLAGWTTYISEQDFPGYYINVALAAKYLLQNFQTVNMMSIHSEQLWNGLDSRERIQKLARLSELLSRVLCAIRDEDMNMGFLPYQSDDYMRKFLSELKKGSMSEDRLCKSHLGAIIADIERRLDLNRTESRRPDQQMRLLATARDSLENKPIFPTFCKLLHEDVLWDYQKYWDCIMQYQFKMTIEDVAEAECLPSSLCLKNSTGGSTGNPVDLTFEDEENSTLPEFLRQMIEKKKESNQDEGIDALDMYEQMQESVKQILLNIRRKLGYGPAEPGITQQTPVKRGRGRPRKKRSTEGSISQASAFTSLFATQGQVSKEKASKPQTTATRHSPRKNSSQEGIPAAPPSSSRKRKRSPGETTESLGEVNGISQPQAPPTKRPRGQPKRTPSNGSPSAASSSLSPPPRTRKEASDDVTTPEDGDNASMQPDIAPAKTNGPPVKRGPGRLSKKSPSAGSPSVTSPSSPSSSRTTKEPSDGITTPEDEQNMNSLEDTIVMTLQKRRPGRPPKKKPTRA